MSENATRRKPGSKARKESVSFPSDMAMEAKKHIDLTRPKYANFSHYLQVLVQADLDAEAKKKAPLGGKPLTIDKKLDAAPQVSLKDEPESPERAEYRRKRESKKKTQ